MVIMVKNIKKFIYIGIGSVVVLITVICGTLYSKKKNSILLYSDIQGLVEGKREIITFSVDFGDKVADDIVIGLYTNESIIKEMNDKGEDGDKFAGDHIYSCTQSVGLSAGESIVYYAKYKNRKTNELIIRGFDLITEESYKHSSEVMSEIRSSADKYIDSETGYVSYKDVKKAIKAVCDYAEKMQELGEVLDINDNGDSALIRTSNGIWYSYIPNIEGTEASGTDAKLGIYTMQPWYTTGYEEIMQRTDVFQEISNDIANSFEKIEYVSCLMDDAVSLDELKSLGNNQIIIINTHGGYDSKLGSYITTGQLYESSKDYSSDAAEGRIILCGTPDDFHSGRVAITEKFVRDYMGDLSHSMVYLGACDSIKDLRLASSFIEKGADVVIGFTDITMAQYDRGIFRSIMESLCTYSEKNEEYNTIQQAIAYAKKINGKDDSTYKVNPKYKGSNPSRVGYIGNPDYRLFDERMSDLKSNNDTDGFNLETDGTESIGNIASSVVKNEFYYNHGFDKLHEVKVGETINTPVYIVKPKNKFIGKETGTYQISKYYRFDGNETFPQKDGYEWCYYQYVSPYNQNGYGDNEYTPMQITDCLRYFESPIWKNDINDDGFYKFSVTTDDGTYDDCLYMRKDRKTSTDDVCNCWFRIPKGYDGITVLHGCMESWEYKQKYGKYPDYSIDLITDDTSFFRLTNY